MKKLLLVPALLLLAIPVAARAATWEKAPLVDHMCLGKAKVRADPDAHPTACLIKCANSGYGILTPDGAWLKFDEAGNERALAALKATPKKDHIRVNVTGEQNGDTLRVSSLAIAD